MRTAGRRAERAKGFTLLELIVALSLSVFVLIGVIQAATTIIAIQLDTHRRGAAEGYSLVGALQLTHDMRDATFLACPGTTSPYGNSCSPANNNKGNVLSGCTNWSINWNGGPAVLSSNVYPAGDECAGSLVRSFYYCTPNSTTPQTTGADVRLVRYVKCGATCSIPAPPSCGTNAAGATMSTLVPAYPGFWLMDGLNYYYERADDVGGAAVHFIVGVGTATVAGTGTRSAPIAVSYKYNMRIGMNKSYNVSNE